MIPWQKIDTARIPGTDGELRLMRRGAEFSIMLGSNELMNSRLHGSEAALATLAAEKIDKVARPHVLIGGVGTGSDGGHFWRQPERPPRRDSRGGCRSGDRTASPHVRCDPARRR